MRFERTLEARAAALPSHRLRREAGTFTGGLWRDVCLRELARRESGRAG